MQNVTPPQLDLIHGAGGVEAAVMRWYLYSLTNPSGPVPFPPGGLRE